MTSPSGASAPRAPAARAHPRRGHPAGGLWRRLAPADLALFRVLRTRGHAPEAVRAVVAYSRLGEHAAAWLVLGTAGAVLDRSRRSRWRRATASVVGAQTLNSAVKLAVRRQRPVLDDLPALVPTPTRLSFPSAHSSSSFAAARAFSSGLLPAGPLYVAAAAMALSRVYLGVHYPTDVAAGAFLGTAIGSAGR